MAAVAAAMLYSPTSPAGTEASEPPSPPSPPSPARITEAAGAAAATLATETEATARLDQAALDTTEPVAATTGRGSLASKAAATAAQQPRPVLCVGPNFDKEYPLNPNHWVKVGRSKKAQLFLNNVAISRNHCSLRWDRHQRIVELRDTSTGGTLVNGETVKGERRTLTHADRIRIEGKSIRYDLLLDLRPVGLGFTDPREESAGAVWQQLQARKMRIPLLQQRKEALKLQIAGVWSNMEQKERECFEKEREFHEIAMRRNLRLTQDVQRQEDLEKFVKGKKALEQKLDETRQNWLARIQDDHELTETELRPLLEAVSERQVKLEKLQLKKDELERTIHPERYAVADVSRVGSYPMELPTPEKTPPSREPSEAEQEDDRNLRDMPIAPASGKHSIAPGSILDPGQLDSSAEEPEMKKPRLQKLGPGEAEKCP